MSVASQGVDAVFQFSTDYLRSMIESKLNTELSPCSATDVSAEFGGVFVEATGLVFEYSFVLTYGGTSTFVDLTIQRLDGRLESGPSSSQLSDVDEVRLRYPLEVDSGQTDGQTLVLKVPFDFPVESHLTVPLELSLLTLNGVVGEFADPPGSVKMIGGDVVAIGLNLTADSRTGPPPDFSKFHASYGDDLISPIGYRPSTVTSRTDWAIELAQWLVETIVEATDLSSVSDRLRNTTVSLTGMNASTGKVQIEVTGQVKVGIWHDFTAHAWTRFYQAKRGVQESTVDMYYFITSASARGIDVLSQVKSEGQQEGTRRVIEAAYTGESTDPAGHLYALDVYPVSAGFVIRGAGTNKFYEPALPVLDGDGVFARSCEGHQDIRREAEFVIENRDDGERRRSLEICAVELEGADAQEFEVAGGLSLPLELSPGDKESFIVRFNGTESRRFEATLVVLTSKGAFSKDLRAFLSETDLALAGDFEYTTGRSCSVILLDRARLSIKVWNRNRGSFQLCRVSLSNLSGGTWNLASVRIVHSNPFFSAQVPMRTTGPNEWEPVTSVPVTESNSVMRLILNVELGSSLNTSGQLSADLHVETTGRDFTQELTITEGEEQATVGGAWRDAFEGVGIDTPLEMCLKGEELGRLIEAWNRLNGEILDDFWEATERGEGPDCCPEPHQPVCLCRNLYDVRTEGIPVDTRIVGEVPDEFGGFEYVRMPTRASILVPYSKERPAEVQIDPSNHGTDPAVLKLRRWQISRPLLWESDSEIRDIAGFANGFAVLSDDSISILRVGDQVERVRTLSLDRSYSRLAHISDQIIASGDGFIRVIDAGSLETQHLQTVDGFEYFVPIQMAHRGALEGFGVRPGGIGWVQYDGGCWNVARQARALGELQFDVRLANKLLLYNGSQLRAYDAALESVWTYDRSEIRSVFALGDVYYLFTQDETLEVLDTSREGAELIGKHYVETDIADALPGGKIQFDGRYFAARHRDANMVNIYDVAPVPIGTGSTDKKPSTAV